MTLGGELEHLELAPRERAHRALGVARLQRGVPVGREDDVAREDLLEDPHDLLPGLAFRTSPWTRCSMAKRTTWASTWSIRTTTLTGSRRERSSATAASAAP